MGFACRTLDAMPARGVTNGMLGTKDPTERQAVSISGPDAEEDPPKVRRRTGRGICAKGVLGHGALESIGCDRVDPAGETKYFRKLEGILDSKSSKLRRYDWTLGLGTYPSPHLFRR